jgi:hypothetical protein
MAVGDKVLWDGREWSVAEVRTVDVPATWRREEQWLHLDGVVWVRAAFVRRLECHT